MIARAFVLGASVLLCAPSIALAEPGPEDQKRAAESFRQAEAAFTRKEYAAAAAAFELAAGFAPHPTAWLNAAEAWELAGEPVRAANACARAQALADGDPSLQAEASKRLASLAPKVALIDLAGPARMRVRIDGGEELGPPLERYVSPGMHRIEVRDPENASSRTVTITPAPGATERVDITPPSIAPIAPIDPTPPKEPPTKPRPLVPAATWVSFGVAAAGAIAVGVLGGLTIAAQSTFEDEPTRDHADAFYAYRLGTNVCVAVAGAAALSGAIVWIVDSARPAPAVAALPWLSPDGAGAVIGGHF